MPITYVYCIGIQASKDKIPHLLMLINCHVHDAHDTVYTANAQGTLRVNTEH